MALTYTTDLVQFEGTKKVVRGLVTFDSSYPTGGEAITLADLGLTRLDDLHVESDDGVMLEWNRSTSAPKIKAYRNTGSFTDSSGGTAGTTVAAGVGKYLITVPVNLATVANGDVLTTMPIPHKFKILSVDAYVTQEVTTADKLTTLNVEITTTDITGGAVALTSANTATLGAKVAGSAVTAANTGAADATISIEAASTTAFAEGSVMVVIGIQNMDTADAFASLAAMHTILAGLLDDNGTLAPVAATTDLLTTPVTGTIRVFGR